MLLQDSQGRSPNLQKNRCRINIPLVAWEYERNIQPISQCYPGASTFSEIFGNRIISRHTNHHCNWAPYSPDLCSLNFSVWNYVKVNMKKTYSSTLESLNVFVEDVLSGISEDLLRKIAWHVRKRTVLCVQENGRRFEN